MASEALRLKQEERPRGALGVLREGLGRFCITFPKRSLADLSGRLNSFEEAEELFGAFVVP